MPFSVVLTEENSRKLISLVPSNWIKDDLLFWPNIRKTAEIERLRREEKEPSKDWKIIKCKVKAQGIDTFSEGIKIENIFASFEDTEDEDRYYQNSETKRKHPTYKAVTDNLLDLNSDFEIENVPANSESQKSTMNQENLNVITKNNENQSETNENQNGDQYVTIALSEFNNLIESSQQFQALEQQIRSGFAVMQVQLDKLFELIQNKMCNNIETEISLSNEEEIIAKTKIQFPINSKEELDILENKLDMDFQKALVKHFSKVCGTSGKLKIGKIGLQLVRNMFTDELLNQLTWKGIKGCTKVPFSSYIKIRNLFFQIVHLADKSCSAKDADALLQNSAIKHSGQRIKRKSCDMKITVPKKKKIESNENETIDDTSDTINCSIDDSRKVTVLSDVKITNKTVDSKHEVKILNISSDNLLSSPVFKQNAD